MKHPGITILFSDYRLFKANCMATSKMVARGITISGWPAGPLHATTDEHGVSMNVVFAKGTLFCQGVNRPYSKLRPFIRSTRRGAVDLGALEDHTFHLTCRYDRYTGNGVEATLDLFRLATMFAPMGVSGIVHDSGQQCLGIDEVNQIVGDARSATLDTIQRRLVNIRPIAIDGIHYFVSRGARELGSRNVCVLDDQHLSESVIEGVIYGLINYVRRGAVIGNGERIALRDIGMETLPMVQGPNEISLDDEDDVLLVRVLPG